jgi:hypothetical protein
LEWALSQSNIEISTSDIKEDDYDFIENPHAIQNKIFDSESNPPNPLFIACSGGNGHISAIKALSEYIKQQFEIELTQFQSTPYHSKKKSLTGFSIFVASKINYFKYFRKITTLLKLPVLPNKVELEHAIEELESNLNPRHYLDVLLDIYPIGYESAAIWNIYQRTDQKSELLKLIRLQSHNDALFYADVYHYYLQLFCNARDILTKPYTEVISTQVMGLLALCDAVGEYNRLYSENLVIHQYMTDLPTTGAVHFFHPLSKLSERQQSHMKIYAVNLMQSVLHTFFPKGHAFQGIYNIEPDKNPMIRAGFLDSRHNNSQSLTAPVSLTLQDGTSIPIDANLRVASIMLGSQASNDTVKYIEHLISSGMDKVFIFGGTNDAIRIKIEELLRLRPDLTSKVALLSNQEDAFIASLMTRSEILVIRAGGLSVMEQLAMPHPTNQKILIHHADSVDGKMQSGISWEDKNADELIRVLKNVKVIKTCPSQAPSGLAYLFSNEGLLAEQRDVSDDFLSDFLESISAMEQLTSDPSLWDIEALSAEADWLEITSTSPGHTHIT